MAVSLLTQDKIIEHIILSKQKQNIYRTILLLGDSPASLRQIAFQITQTLVCENVKNISPYFCQKCQGCITLQSNLTHLEEDQVCIHPDVFFIRPRGTKHIISIDQIRGETTESKEEAGVPGILEESRTRPWQAKYKIFILDGADDMQDPASNALLKILEEPPEYCIFLLTAQNENRILSTILSRCQKFRIISSAAKTVEDLSIEYKLPVEQSKALWQICRQNVNQFENNVYKWKYRTEFLRLVSTSTDLASILNYIQKSKIHLSTEELFFYFTSFWYDVFIFQQICDPQQYVTNVDFLDTIQSIATKAHPNRVSRLLDHCLKMSKPRILMMCNTKIFWSCFLVQSHSLTI